MRRGGRWLPVTLAALLAVAAPAEARTRQRVDITQTVAVLGTSGGVIMSAGANAGTPGGPGAVTGRTTVEKGVFETVFTNFYDDGSFRAISLLRLEQR
jgi:hypothetical protein